ncbi:MBL fold metallo-hydrolase [Staphylococcus lutrae]|uniref:Hydroxyacylglutathione hydrolase n=1 Tax=Staphylococcus lutrae TaxID=155085 RepID=A0AAC9RMQ6_9STAP|nr:MBL fold metallo-hydrolase [Staphylococcus lutrae]ARJ49851.1 hydroxyacylglutathione hydrolase [Staphylococcus lutrae]PNZ37786.1 MBL fold metallo-hydrolase [Staphylococcus lutrae]
MKISFLTLGVVSTNTYFVENDTDLLLFDPAGNAEKIIEKIKQSKKTLQAILLTHAHFDHIAALDDVLKTFPVPVYMHQEEFSFLKDPEKNGSAKFTQYGLPIITSHAQPIALDESTYQIGSFSFETLHTPGHSPGSLTYVFDEFAIVGDTLFNNGIGRTDLYQGDYETLVDSIKDKLFSLNDQLPLYPGHGPLTTVENEYMNPFLDGEM